MDKRTLAAFALMFLIYMYFFQPKATKHPPVAPNTATETDTEVAGKSQPPTNADNKGGAHSPLEEKVTTLKNTKVIIEINALGNIQKATFTKYKSHLDDPTPIQTSFQPMGFNSEHLILNGVLPEWKLNHQNDTSLMLEASAA